jgi:hypothetical protein
MSLCREEGQEAFIGEDPRKGEDFNDLRVEGKERIDRTKS